MNQSQLSLLATFQREVVEPIEPHFRCVNDTVLIRKLNTTGDVATSKGIMLPTTVVDQTPMGIITGTGNKAPEYYAKGLTVLYNANAKLEVIVNGTPYLCMSWRDIRCFVNPDFDRPANEIYIPTEGSILLLKTPKGRQTTDSGIEIPVSANHHNHTGMICALGTNVTEFEVGNFILYSSYVDSEVMLKDFGSAKAFAIFDKNFILGTLYEGAYVWDKSLTWEEKERERRLREVARKQGLLLDGKEA